MLARGPRVRVDAEIIRDIALSASGLLDGKIGGPRFIRPFPMASWRWVTARRWLGKQNQGRSLPPGHVHLCQAIRALSVLQVFDAPTGESPCPRRVRSNTPLQALTTLNDPVFVEAAQALALRVWKQGGKDDRARLHYAFELCTGRKPRAKEAGVLSSLCMTRGFL
jgi:hypothetical protein